MGLGFESLRVHIIGPGVYARTFFIFVEGRQTEEVASRTYIAIDLKSFYASVECVERGLDPLDTNLVVAECYGTGNSICLHLYLRHYMCSLHDTDTGNCS